MFGFSKDASPGKRKKKRSNLEFDFITGPTPGSRPATVKKAPPLTVEPEEKLPATPSEPQPEISINPDKEDFIPANSEPSSQSEPQPEEPPSMSPFNEPTPIRATESICRQKKEQSTVNAMLNGVVISIICAILIITALAGTGAYVMWKQINNQSATIAILESNTNDKFTAMQRNFTAENQRLADTLALTNQQIVDLNKQLAEAQKNIDALRRAQAQTQRRLDNQDVTIERLRNRNR